MPTGRVRWFNEQKGFGYIAPDDRSEQLFFHSSSIIGGYQVMEENEPVAYDRQQSDKGPRAANVQKLSVPVPRQGATQKGQSATEQGRAIPKSKFGSSRGLLIVIGVLVVALIGFFSLHRDHAKLGDWVDPNDGLMWTSADNGADVNLDAAMTYCRDLRLGGFSDWRLPDRDELSGLYDPEHDPHMKGGIELSGKSVIWSNGMQFGEVRAEPLFLGEGGYPGTSSVRALCVRLARLAPNAYELRAIDAQVRSAVEHARASAAQADEAYRLASKAGNSAQTDVGYTTLKDPDGSTYTGHVAGESGEEYPNGLGVSTEADGTFYAGMFVKGVAEGYGLFIVPSSAGKRVWVGQMAGGHASGTGKLLTPDGSTFLGLISNGFGVIDFKGSGLRYEGQTEDGVPQGYGLMWDRNGELSEQGVWEKGELTTPLGVPGN
jgi:CspA family cold shock protein